MIAYPGPASYLGDDIYDITEVDLNEEGFWFSTRGYGRNLSSFWPYRMTATTGWENT